MTCDIVERFIQILSEIHPAISEAHKNSIEQRIRQEYAGEKVYIRKTAANRHERIRQRFTGNNIDRLAKEIGVSCRTIRRAVTAKPSV